MFVHAHGELSLERCLVMGIVNRTPDSFFDGGRMDLDLAVEHALKLEAEGADLLDLGAVKAGPGAEVTMTEEWARLEPLIVALKGRTGLPLSIETARPDIVHRSVAAGASIVNDVSGLQDPELASAVATTGAGLILMHNGGQIRGRPRHPLYEDVLQQVAEELELAATSAEAVGVAPDRVMIDPGLDFGKTTFHSLELMRRLDELTAQGRPVLVAASRKDVIGETLSLEPEERLEGSLALIAVAVIAGAKAVRVHDVKASVLVVRMVEAVMGTRLPAAPVRGLWD